MKKLRFFIAVSCWLLAVGFVSAATWVDDPNNCPVIFKSQQGISGTKLCGYDGSAAYFYDMSNLASPSSSSTFTASQGSFSGFVLDCESYSGSEPFCLNSARCVRSSSCYSVNRITECTDWGVFSCGSCGTGYQACDGSFTDANGCEVRTGVTSRGTNVVFGPSCGYQCSSGYLDCNGDGSGSDGACEIRIGVTPFSTSNAVYQTCTTATCASGWQSCGGETATADGCNTQTGSACTTGEGKPGTWVNGCICQELAQEHFVTNTLARGWGDFLLFGMQFNPVGWLMKLTNANNESIGIDNESCIVFKDGSRICGANDVTLPDGGSDVGSGSGGIFVGKTNLSYSGDLFFNGSVGYLAAHDICDDSFLGSHLCTQSEIMNTPSYVNVSNVTDWAESAWISSGGAKYSPAPVPANDCNGFTHGTSDSYLGNFWIFDKVDGGVGGLGHCANSIPLACCR